jgi:hypothetical protein
MHGGRSTGPRTPEGLARLRAARTIHGHYDAATRARDRFYPTAARRGALWRAAIDYFDRLPPELQARLDRTPPELQLPTFPAEPLAAAQEPMARRAEAEALAPWRAAIKAARAMGRRTPTQVTASYGAYADRHAGPRLVPAGTAQPVSPAGAPAGVPAAAPAGTAPGVAMAPPVQDAARPLAPEQGEADAAPAASSPAIAHPGPQAGAAKAHAPDGAAAANRPAAPGGAKPAAPAHHAEPPAPGQAGAARQPAAPDTVHPGHHALVPKAHAPECPSAPPAHCPGPVAACAPGQPEPHAPDRAATPAVPAGANRAMRRRLRAQQRHRHPGAAHLASSRFPPLVLGRNDKPA